MPLPLLLIGGAIAVGAAGAGKTIKAGVDTFKAKTIAKDANEAVRVSAEALNNQRFACGKALTALGSEKLSVLNRSVTLFIDTYIQIQNVDFQDSIGLEELKGFHIDEKEFEELRAMASYAVSATAGVAGGAALGGLAALGAWGAASTFATASTGTAIAALSGAAATNATLAFFGGGSLAAGGLGMAGGAAVLGGIVAAPALLVAGLVAGHAAKKNLDKALTSKAEAEQIVAQHETASLQCEAIRRRTYSVYSLLARLDAMFLPLVFKLENVLKNEGVDYRYYTHESKSLVASCVSIALSIKALLDTPLLTEEGVLTEASDVTIKKTEAYLTEKGQH